MATEQQFENASNESKKSLIGTLPEALFIAGLTALAYWLAFLYQVSYLHFFDLPPDLAEVSLQSILLVVLALAALSTFFWSLNLVPIFLSDDPSRHRFIFPFAVLPLLGSAWVYYFGLRIKDWFFYLFFFFPAIWVISNIILVALSVRNRWNPALLVLRHTRPTTLMQGISHAFGPRSYGITAIVVLLSGLACISGFGKAATQEGYFLFYDDREIAVIRIYSDRILAVPFDRKNKTIRSDLIIRRIDKEDVKLTLDKNVGPPTTQK